MSMSCSTKSTVVAASGASAVHDAVHRSANFSSAETPEVGSSSSSSLGRRGQRHGDVEQLAHAAGELRDGRSPCRRGRSAEQQFERLVAARCASAGDQNDKPVLAQPEMATSKIFDRREFNESCGIWNEREMPSRATLRGESSLMSRTVERDRAGVGLKIAGDHVDEGRLAGAVGADQADPLAGRDVDVHGVGGDDRAEALVEPAHRKDRVHSAASSSSRRLRRRAVLPVPVPDPERADAARQEQDHAQQEDAEHELPSVGKVEVRERTHQLQRHRGDKDRGNALVSGQHRHEHEFARVVQ